MDSRRSCRLAGASLQLQAAVSALCIPLLRTVSCQLPPRTTHWGRSTCTSPCRVHSMAD
jgi:hypothetical protein